MNKIMLGGALLGAIALAGCNGTDQNANLVNIIQEVQVLTADTSAGLNTACGFVPTVSTIANIVSANNAGVTTASQIAAAICAAVKPTTASGSLGAAPAPTVAGVRVNGFKVTG